MRLDSGFWILFALAAVSVAAAVAVKGADAPREAMRIFFEDLKIIVPQIALGITVGALFRVLLPKELISKHLGEQSGLKGLFIASALGAVMPGGPFTSFPIVVALGQSGAALGPLISFLVGWEAIGMHRMLVWEFPFMGGNFALLRFLSSFPLPIIAGLLANWLASRFPRLRPELDR